MVQREHDRIYGPLARCLKVPGAGDGALGLTLDSKRDKTANVSFHLGLYSSTRLVTTRSLWCLLLSSIGRHRQLTTTDDSQRQLAPSDIR